MVKLHLQDENAVSFAPQVIDILNSTLPVSSSLSPADAARALNALYPHSLPEDDPASASSAEEFLWWFWELFNDLPHQLPHDSVEQDRMVAIVKELYDLPPMIVGLGIWGMVNVWRDLPLMAQTLRDNGIIVRFYFSYSFLYILTLVLTLILGVLLISFS